jgi:hypothetical protein
MKEIKKANSSKTISTIKISITIVALCAIGCNSFQPETSSGKWSDNQGNMNWFDAQAKCKSLGMQLPPIDELRNALSLGEIESWRDNEKSYWSSTFYELDKGKEFAYTINLNLGIAIVGHVLKGKAGVRCIR